MTISEVGLRERMEAEIWVRLTHAEKKTFKEAAEKAGLDVSAWLRTLGIREIGNAGDRE